MSILDDFTDAVSDAVDTIGDAGDLIGGILKTVSPILATIPGIGTAFAVAVYAAGAVAAKDAITDAMIGTASAAMPPSVPRIAFDGATSITRDVVAGRGVLSSAVDACREAAETAGGAPAVEAFDAGMAVLDGGEIDQRLIDQGRDFALQGGGQAAAVSYDAGVSIARGKRTDQVVIDVSRGYIQQMGGAAALAAFDTGIALGYGKALQEAGYIGLHTLVRGNNGIEKVLNFVEEVGYAASHGMDLQQSLEFTLAMDFVHADLPGGIFPDSGLIDQTLAPYIDAIRKDVGILERPAGALAEELGIDEAIIRMAQALMRRGDGAVDEEMLARLRSNVDGATQGTFDFSEKDTASNDRLAVEGLRIINAGAKWRGIPLSDIRNGKKLTITHPRFDALTGITSPGTDTWNIDDGWRRGFDIGICTAQGTSQKNPDQVHANAVVRMRLVGNTGDGFKAAEAIQFERTRFAHPFDSGMGSAALSLPRILALDRPAVGDSINAARPRIEALTEEPKATATLGESISAQGKVVRVPVSKEAKATQGFRFAELLKSPK